MCCGDRPCSFTFAFNSFLELDMVIYLPVSGCSNKGIFILSHSSLYTSLCSRHDIEKPAKMALRSPSMRNVFSNRFSRPRSVLLGLRRHLILVLNPPFAFASTSSHVILPTWVCLEWFQHLESLLEGRRISLLCIKPCHCDAHNAQYVKSLISSSFITAGIALISSASRGILHVGDDRYSFCEPLVTPLNVSVKYTPIPAPGALSLMCS